MKRQIILNPKNTLKLNTVLINGKEYILDKFELKKYNQYKIEGNPIKEEMFFNLVGGISDAKVQYLY